MTAEKKATKTKNGSNLTLSARVPEVMPQADATNTTWKNHADAEAWPRSITPASLEESPASKAISASFETWCNATGPNQPPGSTATYMMLKPTRK